MYLLEVESSFEAAHRLENYEGPCRRIHGHHWVVRALYEAATLDRQGMAIDLVTLKKQLRHVLSQYDHQSLNTIMTTAPTSENLARVIFGQLRALEGGSGKQLVQVEVGETPGCKVIYRED